MATSKNRGPSNAKFIARGPGGEKRCSRCHTLRPIAEFNIDQSRYDGRGYICAPCRDKERNAAGPTLRERKLRRAEGLAWCSGCVDWKAATAIRAGVCQPCANRKMRKRYAADPNFRNRRRGRGLARRRDVEPMPPDGRERILEEFDGRCAYCTSPATTWDHVVAVTKGGLTEPHNMVPACGPCNSSKRTQNVWTWLDKTGRLAHPQLVERLSLYHAGLFPSFGPDPFD